MGSKLRGWFVGLLALALAAPASAQTFGTISGHVTDRAAQRPLGSAQVHIVGTPRGTQTDENGAYRIINVPPGQVTIRVQRIGYAPQSRTVTVSANAATTVDVELNPSATVLEQVLITATGQSERRRESGVSTAVIDSSIVNKASVATFSDALSSRAPGVVVQTASGETGSGSRIRIRGSNSISLSNDPLLIIDGVRADNTAGGSAIGTGGQIPSRFNDINPEEIENIEVIKGPAAAALYGTAAANGVIQVTTKKGRSGKTRWDGFLDAGDLHDVNTYPENYRTFGRRADGTTLVTNCNLFSLTSTSATRCATPDSTITNLPLTAARMIGEGSRRIGGVSAAGGSDAATYFLSGEYSREQGVIPINAQQRLNLRSNVRSQLARSLDANLSVGYSRSDLRRPQDDNNAYGVVSGSMLGKAADCGPRLNTQHPTICGTDTLSHGYYNPGLDPKAFYNINTRQKIQRLTGSLNSNWTPLTWLGVNGTFGADITNRNESETLPPSVLGYSQSTLDGYRGVYKGLITDYTANLSAHGTYNYSPTMKFVTTLASQFTDVGFNRTDAYGAKLLAGTDALGGTTSRFSVGETTTDVRTLGFIGSEQFAWRDRLFLNGAIRTDRNSAFGQNFQRIYYPALSGSWVVSDEDFFPKAATKVISSLRVRAALGTSGQNPGYLAADQYFNPVAVVVNGVDVPGFTIGGVGNPDLRAERSRETEGGLDLGFFDGRINAEYTYYTKRTRDALVNVNLAPSLGTSTSRFMNLGQVHNWGNEAQVRANVVDRGPVHFDLTVNGTWNSNRVDTLGYDVIGNPIPPIYLGFNGNSQIIKTGQPLGAYWQPAILGYADANGDGLISASEVKVDSVSSYLGSPFPAAEITVVPAFDVGSNVRITATFDHRSGQKLLNFTNYYRDVLIQNGQVVQAPKTVSLAQQAAAQAGAAYGTFAGYIENDTFTKLREVAVSLTLPRAWAARANAGSATLTLAGRNLHTWTKYTGVDPELNAGGQANFTTADFLTAPQVRYLTARLALSF